MDSNIIITMIMVMIMSVVVIIIVIKINHHYHHVFGLLSKLDERIKLKSCRIATSFVLARELSLQLGHMC